MEIKDRNGRVLLVLARENLHGVDLSGANLSEANLRESDLSLANLRGAHLYRANLYKTYLYGADLSGADLSRAHLYAANLSDADLSETNLNGTSISGVNLSGAKGILTIGPVDSWIMYLVKHKSGHMIKAGCRWFTLAEARAHWNDKYFAGERHAKIMLCGVDALFTLAKINGWDD